MFNNAVDCGHSCQDVVKVTIVNSGLKEILKMGEALEANGSDLFQ